MTHYLQDYVMGRGDAFKLWLRIDEPRPGVPRRVTAWHEGERYVCCVQMPDVFRAYSGGVGVIIPAATFVYNGVWLWREADIVRAAARWKDMGVRT